MEYKDLEEKDNASLMSFVKEARELMHGAVKSESYVNTPELWALFKKTRVAEEMMKFRNLPLDHDKLGDRFELSDFRSHVLIENPDQKEDDQEN